MAHKKGQGSTKNNRDSESKRLGVKKFGGQTVIPGNIIIRQRGTKFHPGLGVGIGKDHTIYALDAGVVTFTTKKNNRKFVNVLPIEESAELTKQAKKEVAAPKAKKEAAPKAKKEAKPEVAAAVTKTKAEPKEEAKKEKKATPKAKASAKGDDLRKIEGVGPKISELLSNAGLSTFDSVAKSTPEKISEILAEAGKRYQMHNPTTWPKQAQLAADGKWDELKVYQDNLDGGVEKS